MVVDRDIVLAAGSYTFRNFILLTEEEKIKVWNWRNEESIRRFMYNKELIPFENHLKFLEGLKNREDVYYWLVERDGVIVGVNNLTSVDLHQSRAELGYYMVPEMQKKGIGRNINAVTLDSYLGCKLNQEDLENLDSIKYIRWEVKQKDFIADMEGKNDFRRFVRYTRDNKELFDKVKQYA